MKLLEVPFKDGYSEFIEYFSKEIKIEIPEDINEVEYRVELLEDEILKDSITYNNILNKNIEFSLEVISIGKINYLIIKSFDNFLGGLKLNVYYTYKNNNPKYLYSVDYINGLIHFSEKTTKEYKIEYQHDSILCIGKKAEQLFNEDYNIVSKNINIKNYKENSLIYFLYTKEKEEHRSITPVLKDLKLNYIIKDDISL